MIHVRIQDHHHVISGFTIKGHADAGAYGHDIVCAAVSVLSITTVNGIISITGVRPQVQSDQINGGLLMVKVPQIKDPRTSLQVQTLLKNLELGIQDLAKRYATHVNLKMIS